MRRRIQHTTSRVITSAITLLGYAATGLIYLFIIREPTVEVRPHHVEHTLNQHNHLILLVYYPSAFPEYHPENYGTVVPLLNLTGALPCPGYDSIVFVDYLLVNLGQQRRTLLLPSRNRPLLAWSKNFIMFKEKEVEVATLVIAALTIWHINTKRSTKHIPDRSLVAAQHDPIKQAGLSTVAA